MKIRMRVLIPVFIAEIILVSIFLSHQSLRQSEQLTSNLRRIVGTFEKLVDSEISADVSVMLTAVDALGSDPNIASSLQATDIQRLIALTEPVFASLKKRRNISHFYFHSPERINLYRLHHPEHNGDTINRITLLEAEKTGQVSFGVEQGPTGASVLRVVIPIDSKGRRIGYIEVGKEFQDITHEIQKIMGLDVLVLADKRHVNEQLWIDRNNKDEFKSQWDFNPHYVVMASTLAQIPEELRSLRNTEKNEPYVFEEVVEKNRKIFDLMILPYKRQLGGVSTKIVLVHDSTEIRALSRKSTIIMGIIGIGVLTLLFGFYFVFLGRVEKHIHNQETSIIASSKLASLGEMAGGVAHEINTPLATVRLLAGQIEEALRVSKTDKAHILDLTRRIEKTVDRIATIVAGLRTFARDTSQDPMTEVNVDTVFKDVALLCQERFKNHGVDLRILGVPSNLSFLGRSAEISQVIMILLNNAFDAVESQPHPWIELLAKGEGESLCISVTDSGPGISKEVGDKVFQPFFTTKEIGKGTGLGLSIALGLVKSHRGKIKIDYSSLNTRFNILLPRLR